MKTHDILRNDLITDLLNEVHELESAAPTDFENRSFRLTERIGYPTVVSYCRDILRLDHNPLLLDLEDTFLPISITSHKNDIERNTRRIEKISSETLIVRYVFRIVFTIGSFDVTAVGFFPNQPVRIMRATPPIAMNYCSDIHENVFINKIFEEQDFQDAFLSKADNGAETFHQMYLHYSSVMRSTFMENMRTFIEAEPVHMFSMIRYLLMGGTEHQNTALLLMNLLKEKKTNVPSLMYNYFLKNLSLGMQSKLDRRENTIEDEIKNIRETKDTQVDLRTQVLVHKTIPLYVKKKILDKIDEILAPSPVDTTKQMLYVKTLLAFPWPSDDENNDAIACIYRAGQHVQRNYVTGVMAKLNESVYGQESAKQMILYFLSKWIRNKDSQGASLSLYGPPGIGKTLFAQSIAQAIGIPFVQLTLGGQNDGDLLHGHSYTYNTSSPGMIIQKIVSAGNCRCVFLLDEIDKCTSRSGSSINEIMSILIHITDPNTNHAFQDRFFQDIDFPLQRVLFITSYNNEMLIDRILLDRLIRIELKGFRNYEKIQIAQRFLIPTICKDANIDVRKIKITTNNLRHIIHNYTNESGVRELKKNLQTLILHYNFTTMCGPNHAKTLSYSNSRIDKIIQKEPIPRNIIINQEKKIGCCHCLYVTPMGVGGVSMIQVVCKEPCTPPRIDVITGNVGNTMKESIQCAFTAAYALCSRDMSCSGSYHVHVLNIEEGKEGASAGAAFCVAFCSLFTNRPIPQDVAVSGEVDTLGVVYPVYRTSAKCDAALLYGIRHVFLGSMEEKEATCIGNKLTVHYVNSIDTLMRLMCGV